jgi:hypothetical protein
MSCCATSACHRLRPFTIALFGRKRRGEERKGAAKEISVKKYVVRLSGDEREQLEALIRKGKSAAQRLLKARILDGGSYMLGRGRELQHCVLTTDRLQLMDEWGRSRGPCQFGQVGKAITVQQRFEANAP